VTDRIERRAPSPSLAVAGRYSFAFTFFQRLPPAGDRLGVRIPALFEHVRREGALYHALVEPPLSFFRDIVDADQGLVSMPLVAAIDPVRGDPALPAGAHDVDVTLPDAVRYDAETRHVVLEPAGAGGQRVLPLAFRDALAIFESGHLAYVFSLVSRPARPAALTEYEIILLEKLVSPTEGCEYLRHDIRWARPGAPGATLVEFVTERLAAARRAADPAPNAVRDLVHRFVLEPGEALAPWRWAHLRSMAIVLDDGPIQEATTAALASAGPGPNGGAAARAGTGGGAAPHMPAGKTDSERIRLALAGITQGVLDFPEQDASEIGDSLSPVLAAPGVEMFSHPRFLVEICQGSRSLAAMEGCLGSCPYVFLSHLVFAYNKRLLEEAESSFEQLRLHRRRRFRYRPFETLGDIIRGIDFPLGEPTRFLHRSLRIRFELLRDLIVSYIPNVFRYRTERSLYEELSTRHGLRGRHTAFVEWLAHYENVVKGAHDLGQFLAERRTNRLLLVIAVIGLLSVVKDTAELLGLGAPSPRFTVPLVAAVAALVAGVVGREAWAAIQSRLRRGRLRTDRGGDPLGDREEMP